MLLHLGQNVITFRTLLHLGSFIRFRHSTGGMGRTWGAWVVQWREQWDSYQRGAGWNPGIDVICG